MTVLLAESQFDSHFRVTNFGVRSSNGYTNSFIVCSGIGSIMNKVENFVSESWEYED